MEATEFDCAHMLLGGEVEADISCQEAVACLAREAAPRLHSLAALTKASLTDGSSEVRLAAAKALSGIAKQARSGEFDVHFSAAGRSLDLFEKVVLLALIHDSSDEVGEFAKARVLELSDDVIVHQAVDAQNERQSEFAVRLYDTSLDYEERQSLIAKAASARRPELHSLAAVLRAALFDASSSRWDRSEEKWVRHAAADRLLEVARFPENSTIPKRSGASFFYLGLLENVLLLALLYDEHPSVQHEAACLVFRADRDVRVEALAILERVHIEDSEDWPTLLRDALGGRRGARDE